MSKQTELIEFTAQELTKIVERSSTLDERLGNGFVGNAIDISDREIQTRLDRWCTVAARGDAEIFAKRLAWDNLHLDTLRPILGAVKLDQSLPSWTNTLNAVMRALALVPTHPEFIDRCLHPEAQIAFQEVFIPFIQVARQQLIQRTGKLHSLLADNAHAGLEHSLLVRLSQLCFQTFEFEFKLFQIQHQSSLDQLLNRVNPQPSQAQYQTFVQQLLTGKLRSLLQEYSVLSRLVATVVDFWVNATAEMIGHLSEDWAAIAQTFQPDTELGAVVGIRPFLSDSHHNGRTVVGLRFASGLTLIYKPRSLALDVAYYDLLDRLNQQGEIASETDPAHCLNQFPFKTLKILDRSSHGWVEYVTHTPCQTEAELRRYYQRSGMLLALIYALRGTDFHLENLIVSGDQPVPVDLEMLMHPPFRDVGVQEISEAQYLIWKSHQDSVLSTMLLPIALDVDGQSYDISALGAAMFQELKLPTLQAVNTDQMGMMQEKIQPTPSSVSPFAGSTGSLCAYTEDLVTGFEQMYCFLQSQQANLLQPDSCLMQFHQQQGRYLHRNTQIYVTVIHRALRPQFLRDGVDFSIELDQFCRPLLQLDEKPESWAILATERQAMAQLDIPHLKLDSASSDLILNDDQRISHFFARSGYAGIIARIQSLSPNDRSWQTDLIRYAIYTSDPTHLVWQEPKAALSPRIERSTPELSICSETLVQQAIDIGAIIQATSVYGSDDSVHWLTLNPQECNQLLGSGFNLFDGNSGISLFLAALYQETGKPQFYDLALDALQSLRRVLRQGAVTNTEIDIGAARGLGSIVYALVKISHFLQESALLEEAVFAACLIPQQIMDDTPLDLTSGVAGAILAFLTLHQATHDTKWLSQAIAYGHHLLERNQTDSTHLTGMAYGSAGIAYALGRLYAATQQAEFLTGAETAIAHEQQFLQLAQNWRDARSENFYCNWMHGAAGIGLARCGLLPMLDTEIVRHDLELALALTQQVSLDDVDHLCWGNLGRLETVWVAAHRLNRSDLHTFVQQGIADLFQRWHQEGQLRLFPQRIPFIQHPGFFQGTAGIGYQLLRFANPKFPCVLLWE